jgi:hypothetical protein
VAAAGVSTGVVIGSSLMSMGSRMNLAVLFLGSKPIGLAAGSRLAYCFRSPVCQLSRLGKYVRVSDNMIQRLLTRFSCPE